MSNTMRVACYVAGQGNADAVRIKRTGKVVCVTVHASMNKGAVKRYIRLVNKRNKTLGIRERQAFYVPVLCAGGYWDYEKNYRDGSYEDRLAGRVCQPR